MADALVNIEINGIALQARRGAMLIEVADAAGIVIPRFCYHEKLSIAANCRMCLVEVERAPKPLPACATPVAEGMKVHTRSPKALAAQQGTMEFLLINHPLDCPICDQGGECELQDVAMGFGGDVSRYQERKRVVADKDIGPLIATEMTRCIHCTRCVRFGQEIAGLRELGATGRGEHMEIGTYIAQAVSSELSGNVVDLCPVGALTAKPSRYTHRPWELSQHAGVAAHDCVGSNVYLHTRRGRVMRVVPKDNEAVNETWISDRDRFSYEGLYSDDRLTVPMVKRDGQWQETDWESALNVAASGLKGVLSAGGPERLGALVGPNATVEEMTLVAALLRGLGSNNVDHRLRQVDFSDQDGAPTFPWLGQSIEDLESLQAVLLVGSNIRKDQPMAAHRLRKAALQGAQVMCVNPMRYDFHFPLAAEVVASPAGMLDELAGVAVAAASAKTIARPKPLAGVLKNVHATDAQKHLAATLREAERATVLLGNMALSHPELAVLRALCGFIAEATGATLGYLPDAANSAGAWLAGAVPHRGPGGVAIESSPGLSAADMLASPLDGYLVLGAEPDCDCADPAAAVAALTAASCAVAITPYATDATRGWADVLLPAAPHAETSGTFVNAEGRWQSFAAATNPLGEARPAWKVLRVLGNLLDVPGFDYTSSGEILEGLRQAVGEVTPDNALKWDGALARAEAVDGLTRIGDVPLYAADALVRRATALQQTPDAVSAGIYVRATQAEALGVQAGDTLVARQGQCSLSLPVVIDDAVPEGCARIPAGLPGTAALGAAFGPLELERA
jgi:NADH-quinone oxidoreductase subunit G